MSADKLFDYAEKLVMILWKQAAPTVGSKLEKISERGDKSKWQNKLNSLSKEAQMKLAEYYFHSVTNLKLPEQAEAPSKVTVELLTLGFLKPAGKRTFVLDSSFTKSARNSDGMTESLGKLLKARN